MIYLLHFDRPFHHAQHYIGCTDDLVRRLNEHRLGKAMNGSPLIEAARQAGIKVTLARLWDGGFEMESRLKRWHGGRQLCPICDAKALQHANYDQPGPALQRASQYVNEMLVSPPSSLHDVPDLPDIIHLLREEGIVEPI